MSVPQSKTWPCSRSPIENPVGALRVKHASPLTPHGAPSPYPIRFGAAASYAIVAALEARLAVRPVDAA